MDLGIKNKVAFVAGGSKGMGKSAGRFLAEAGCRVGVVAQSQDAIDQAVSEIRDAGGTAVGISADLTNDESVKRAVAELREAFDGVSAEIVVSQTNDMHLGNFDDSSNDDFAQAFQTFTMAQIYLMRAVLPEMKRKR